MIHRSSDQHRSVPERLKSKQVKINKILMHEHMHTVLIDNINNRLQQFTRTVNDALSFN
jgi:hypothetical protein